MKTSCHPGESRQTTNSKTTDQGSEKAPAASARNDSPDQAKTQQQNTNLHQNSSNTKRKQTAQRKERKERPRNSAKEDPSADKATTGTQANKTSPAAALNRCSKPAAKLHDRTKQQQNQTKPTASTQANRTGSSPAYNGNNHIQPMTSSSIGRTQQAARQQDSRRRAEADRSPTEQSGHSQAQQ